MARVTTTTNKAAKKAKGHAPLRLQEVLRRLRIRELLAAKQAQLQNSDDEDADLVDTPDEDSNKDNQGSEEEENDEDED